MKHHLETRRAAYYKLNTRLSEFDNQQLISLLGETEEAYGWGTNHIIKLGKSKVFVKCVPVTDIEYDNMFSTKNLYHLPTYYNYGVGSAGFGVFREILAHIKTTNWVLDGSIENFPLMYHYRIVPSSGKNPGIDIDNHNKYVNYWNGNENIGRYMMDRRKAKYQAILFLEYIPHVLWRWFGKNTDRLDMVLEGMAATITFLRKKGIIHFDAHFGNIMTDGERPYLTDFGLVLDRRFALDENERSFFKRNAYYDYGEFLYGVGSHITSISRALPEKKKKKIMKKYGIEDEIENRQLLPFLLENLDEIYATGLMKLDSSYVQHVIKHRDITLLMHEFFADMSRNNKKDTKYNHTKLRRLLKETGVIPGKTA